MTRPTDDLISATPTPPKDIVDTLFDITGPAILQRDFDTFITCIHLPHEIETPDGIRLLQTRDDAQEVFNNVSRHMAHIGATSILRNCIEANYRNPELILAIHETRLLNGSTLLQAPYPCFSRFVFCDGRWTIQSSIFAIQDSPRHMAALTG